VPGTSGAHEEVANTRTPVWRILHAPTKRGMADLPGKHEVVFLKRSRTTDLIAIRPGLKKPPTNPNAPTNVYGHSGLVNTHPCMGMNPIAWTEAIHEMLNVLAKRAPAAYFALDMRRIFQGHRDHEWTGWSFDGVVRIEQDTTRNSSAYTDGYRSTGFAGGRFVTPVSNDTKLTTIIMTGEQEMLDYFEGRGVVEGASLFFVVKKYTPSEKVEAITYVKSSKAIMLDMSADHIVANQAAGWITIPDQAKIAAHVANARDYPTEAERTKSVKQCLPGVFPVAVPDGGELDPAYAEYEDELGLKQIGAILYAGRVMFLPPRFQGQPALTGPTDPNFKPLTDGRRFMTREHLTVLLPNIKDGSLIGC
jgi:hypothetical protein